MARLRLTVRKLPLWGKDADHYFREHCVVKNVSPVQVHSGMSGAENGSVALTSTAALIRHRALRAGCEQDRLKFEWAA